MKFFLLFFSLTLMSSLSGATKKNIVVILVDDLGANDLVCYGSTFHDTPNIDELAAEGMLFTQGYAAHPVCSPTRAAMMTGKNPCRKEVNITDWIPGHRVKTNKLLGPAISQDLPLKEVTIAETLKANGYSTWFVGKWHLGKKETHWPKAQGFDVNIGGWTTGSPAGGYYAPYKNPVLKQGPDGEYLPDRLTNEAIQLVETRDKDKPFFLYLSFYTVHTPIQACKRHLAKYEEKLKSLPEQTGGTTIKDRHGISRLRQDNPAYASMIYAMDENVGRLMKALKDNGVDKDTVILFTGDNGSLTTKPGTPGPTSVRPLRAGKGWTYEGGIRVPFIIRDLDSEHRGQKSDFPVVNTDFYATIMDYCALEEKPELHKDSLNLKALVDGEESIERSEPLVWHYPHYHGSGFPPGTAIREGDWKLLESYHDGTVELYNINSDVGESENLANQFPEKVAQLRQKMQEYLVKVGAAMPVENPNYKPGTKKATKGIKKNKKGKKS